MFGVTSVMTGVMSPPLDCCAVTDTGTICSAGGHQPITVQDRRQWTNHRPGHAALPSDPGSHVRRGWRPMSQSNVDIIMYQGRVYVEKGNYDLFLNDDLLKSSRVRILIASSTLRGKVELESEIYIHVFIPKPMSKCMTVPAKFE